MACLILKTLILISLKLVAAALQVVIHSTNASAVRVVGSKKTQDKKLILACYEAVKDIGGYYSNHLPIYAKYLCQ
jgi:hypothetical protein